MLKKSLLAIGLLASTAAMAEPVGPEIAYSLRGSRDIYLINPDGSGKRLIYRGLRKTAIFALSLRSGGGEIAFEEVDSTGQTGRLRTVEFGASGIGTVTRTIPGCRFDMDFHPTDGSLLLVEMGNGASCSGDIKRLAPGSTTPVSLGIDKDASKVAWLADGVTILFAAEGRIWKAPADGTTAPQEIVAQDCVASLEAAHQRAQALLDVGSVCGASLDRLTLDPPNLEKGIASGWSPSYAPDDQCFIYIVPAGRGAYLTIRRSDGSGDESTVGSKANYTSVDWRAAPSQPYGCPVVAPAAVPDR